MSWQAIVMLVVVAGVGIPAALRNATAAALTLSWLTLELVYQTTGDSLPLKYSFMADIAVISVIYAKAIRRAGAKVYPSALYQLRCMATDLTTWDRWIVAIFLLGAWPMYGLSIDPWWKWHALWLLTIAQFLFAGGEAVACFLAGMRTQKPTPIIDRHLVVIPFPVERRRAEAAKITPECPGNMLARREGEYG